ncbi:hypothetical protein PsYK624_012160 [Phanerochaete sordida]|uniref:Uncharacterized protein n=1 Tax=Phanerochaete sordida TaxID=48140 RepID=A0A9P3L8L6_9APHY|nr:hypothetical protein PsYK624_012160 [Phanerochaete sordida]
MAHTVQITIQNSRTSALDRRTFALAHGDWVTQPHTTIDANHSDTFRARPAGTVTEGSVTYRVVNSGAEFTVNFRTAPNGTSVHVTPADMARVDGGDHAPLIATVQVLS